MFAVIFILAVIGVVLYLLFTYVPMAQPIKTIIIIFVVLCVVIWLANLMGLMGSDIPVPHFRR